LKLIRHRCNQIDELQATPTDYGIEVDIRSQGDRLVIHHDPFAEGVNFIDWISEYRHGTLILNVKEEGLENALLAVMAERGIDDFFFLDQSFPFLIRTANRGESRCAVRISEFESVETALTLAGKIDWVWIDCFTRFPLTAKDVHRLQKAGFKLCLVSPELQGRFGEIAKTRAMLDVLCIYLDAVCTKDLAAWA